MNTQKFIVIQLEVMNAYCIVQCTSTMYNIHCTLYIVQYTLYIVHCTHPVAFDP